MSASRIEGTSDDIAIFLRAAGYSIIAGTDEAGRGALAGPIVAAAVILSIDDTPEGIIDSKKLTAIQRDRFFEEIANRAISVGIGRIDSNRIDQMGIQKANLCAMMEAVNDLAETPDCVLADWYENPGFKPPWHGVAKGEESHTSIAAASIVAKVTRDRIMVEYALQYPDYGFASHKGYGSRNHIQAINSVGPCPIHRMSYEPCRAAAI
jgi:ribonuclease HII